MKIRCKKCRIPFSFTVGFVKKAAINSGRQYTSELEVFCPYCGIKQLILS